jgi:hypothetical protein
MKAHPARQALQFPCIGQAGVCPFTAFRHAAPLPYPGDAAPPGFAVMRSEPAGFTIRGLLTYL